MRICKNLCVCVYNKCGGKGNFPPFQHFQHFQKMKKPTSQQDFIAVHKSCPPQMLNHSEHFKDNSNELLHNTELKKNLNFLTHEFSHINSQYRNTQDSWCSVLGASDPPQGECDGFTQPLRNL